MTYCYGNICRWHYLFYKVNFHQQSTWDFRQLSYKHQTHHWNWIRISFLDVLLIGSNSLINTKVYRKNSNTDIYINWKSFAPNNWKWRTLKTSSVTRALNMFNRWIFERRTRKYTSFQVYKFSTTEITIFSG